MNILKRQEKKAENNFVCIDIKTNQKLYMNIEIKFRWQFKYSNDNNYTDNINLLMNISTITVDYKSIKHLSKTRKEIKGGKENKITRGHT